MTIKLKQVIHMQTGSVLIVTPSDEKTWLYVDYETKPEPTINELTAEEMVLLETTVLKMETLEAGISSSVFYVSEPEKTEPKYFTVAEAMKISKEIIYFHGEKAYAIEPCQKLQEHVKKEYGIQKVEKLPEAFKSKPVYHLQTQPATGLIEAELE